MEIDDDLKDALTYLDEPIRQGAIAYLERAKDDPVEWTIARIGIIAEAEEAAGRRASERRRVQNRRMMEQAGAKPTD